MEIQSLHLGLIFIPMAIAMYAQWKVSSAFAKGSKLPNARGLTGQEVAKTILQAAMLTDVPVEQTPGKLADHYNPMKRSLSLSPDVYGQKTVAALGVAAHEVGHAIQHRDSYFWLKMRTSMYPVVKFSSWLAPILIIAGFFFAAIPNLLYAGIILFGASVFFTLITLPVEFDASRRALVQINKLGLVSPDESREVKKVLDAAALTYVAAAITAVLELTRLILIARSND